jgi:DnaJ-class molecular chaperone
MSKDLYGVLELSRGAEQNEIRKQYLKLSRQYHPDKVPTDQKESAEEKFKKISEAYEILSDEGKKSYYDQTGQIPGEGGGGGGGFHGFGGMPFPMNEMFGMFGGRQRVGRRNGKAPPKKTQISLTLKDFYYGRMLTINLERNRFCGACKGEGCMNTRSCRDCNGQGTKRQVIQMGPMIMESTGLCGACQGSGKGRGDSCANCSGTKFVKQDKKLQLFIKKGMKPGDIITFSGESSNVEDFSESGDVIVELQAADEVSSWVRDGNNLKLSSTITLGESLCGSKVVSMDHPGYPNGIVLSTPVGVQNKDVLVFVGLGMPIDEEKIGELHLTILVKPSKNELEVLKTNSPYFQGLFTIPDIAMNDKVTIFNAQRFH